MKSDDDDDDDDDCVLYNHQRNTTWAFMQKYDIFTRENKMSSSHVEKSSLLHG